MWCNVCSCHVTHWTENQFYIACCVIHFFIPCRCELQNLVLVFVCHAKEITIGHVMQCLFVSRDTLNRKSILHCMLCYSFFHSMQVWVTEFGIGICVSCKRNNYRSCDAMFVRVTWHIEQKINFTLHVVLFIFSFHAGVSYRIWYWYLCVMQKK